MKLLVFLIGLVLSSSSTCLKRSYEQQYSEDGNVEKCEKRIKQNHTEAPLEASVNWLLFPEELTATFLLATVTNFSSEIEEEPMLDYKLVCKNWYKIIRSPQFQDGMRILPNIAYWIVQKNLAHKKPVPIDALKACLSLLDDTSRYNLLYSAYNTEILEQLTTTTGWALGTLKWRKTLYKDIVSSRIMMAVPFFDPLHETGSLEPFIRELFSIFISFCGSPYECHVLFSIPQHELIKLLLIDDIARIGQDAFLNAYIIGEVLRIYHDRRNERPIVSAWLSCFKNITLPVSRENVLMNMFRFPMTIAVLAGSREFVQFIMGNSFILPEDVFEAAHQLLTVSNHDQDDNRSYLDLLDESFTDEVVQRESIEWMGFNKQTMKLNLERLAALVGPRANVRYILSTEFI